MKRTLSSFVAVVCLLAFFVSSAICLTAALPVQAQAIPVPHMHAVGAPAHACCPGNNSSDRQVSDACCTVHHQPVSVTSTMESQQAGIPAPVVVAVSLQLDSPLHTAANAQPAPLQHPPLIALRI